MLLWIQVFFDEDSFNLIIFETILAGKNKSSVRRSSYVFSHWCFGCSQKALGDCFETAEALRSAGVSFRPRQGSDKRLQAAALQEDLPNAFDQLGNLTRCFFLANDIL